MQEQYIENKRFISILSDYGFKVTFGNESDTRFLKRALQALIKSPVPIKDVAFVESEIKGLTKDSRSGIFDIACTDNDNNHFIVEMQLSEYPEFIQRMKFYALYRFNTFVKKGKYTFEDLPKIYCIGILAHSIFADIDDYHNIANLRNEKGELIDDQMSFVTLELEKFKLEETEVKTDLEKLVYTMQTLHKTTDPVKYPEFWNEDWLSVAIKELDTSALTTEQRLIYEMTISANALAIKNEDRKIQEAKNEEKQSFVISLINQTDFDDEKIANLAGVTTEFVKKVRNKLGATTK